MSTPWEVFVEGRDDKCFIRSLLQYLDVANVGTALIGGGVSKLPSVAPQIQRSRDAGNYIAVVLDANSDFSKRRDEFQRCKDQLELPVDRFFLLPNDSDPGCLETLLEQMAVSNHRAVYDCFDKYETCLQSHGTYQLPNLKARIYAYCEALKIETHASKRNYENPSYWDLNTTALEPLKRFLRDLQAEEP